MSLKQQIIEEALKLFSLKGFLSTSISDILQHAGTSKGGFYNHFRSKDDLFLSVLSEARRIWRERVLADLNQVEGPLDRVKRLLRNYGDLYLKDSDSIPGGCVFLTLSVELDDQRPEFAAKIYEGFEGLKSMIRRLLDQAVRTGDLPSHIDTGDVASILFTGMVGTSVVYGMNKSEEVLGESIGALIRYLESLREQSGPHQEEPLCDEE